MNSLYWLFVFWAVVLSVCTGYLVWVWNHKMRPGEYVCIVTRVPFGRRVWHYHRPKNEIISCPRTALRDVRGDAD